MSKLNGYLYILFSPTREVCITKGTCFNGAGYCVQALFLDPDDTTGDDKASCVVEMS